MGNDAAAAALPLVLPGPNLTLLMCAAAGGREELLRRLLATLPRKDRVAAVLEVRDAGRHNVLFHAAMLSRRAALLELLSHLQACVGAGAGAFSPGPPGDAALAGLGLTLEEAAMLPPGPAQILRGFVADPRAPLPPAHPSQTQLFRDSAAAAAAALAAQAQRFSMSAAAVAAAPSPSAPAPPTAPLAAKTAPEPAVGSTKKGGKARSGGGGGSETKRGGRELQAYVMPGAAGVGEGPLEAAAAQWNQFEQNASLFGVTADFPEGEYTSALPIASAEQVAAAEAVAVAMRAEGVAEGGPEGGGEKEGAEEAQFSAVQGRRAGPANAFSDAGVGAKKKTQQQQQQQQQQRRRQ
jgi:hypothetical protein